MCANRSGESTCISNNNLLKCSNNNNLDIFLLLPTAKKGFKLSETIYFLMLTQVMSGIIVRNYMRHAYATF